MVSTHFCVSRFKCARLFCASAVFLCISIPNVTPIKQYGTMGCFCVYNFCFTLELVQGGRSTLQTITWETVMRSWFVVRDVWCFFNILITS